MKKSFMTRALATGLSLAMAFSLTAATNVTVASAASTPAMASKQFAVRVGGATKTYKASTATRKTFKISKATVGNTSKATVTVAASKKGIKVTPGTVTGSTVVKVTFKNIKTKKSTTKKYRCVVKPEIEEVKELTMTAEATGVKKIAVTFNQAVDTTTTKIAVKKGSATPTIAATTPATDAKSYEVAMGTKLTAGTYTVEATVGEKVLTADITVEDEKLTAFELVSKNLVADPDITTTASISYKAVNQYGEMMAPGTVQATCSFGEIKAGNHNQPTADKAGSITVTNINSALAIVGTTGTLVLVDTTNGINLNETITYQSKAIPAAATIEGIYSEKTEKVVEGNLKSKSKVTDYYILMNIQNQYGDDMDVRAIQRSKSDLSFNPASVLTNLSISDKEIKNGASVKDIKDISYNGKTCILVKFAAGTNTDGSPNTSGTIDKAGTLNLTIVSANKGVLASPSFTVDDAVTISSISISPADTVFDDTDNKLIVDATDSNGNAVTKYDDLKNSISFTNDSNVILKKNADGTGTFYYHPSNVVTGTAANKFKDSTIKTLVCNVNDTTSGNYMVKTLNVTVYAKPQPWKVSGITSKTVTAVASGSSLVFDLSTLNYEDQYGNTMNYDKVTDTNISFALASSNAVLGSPVKSGKNITFTSTSGTKGSTSLYLLYKSNETGKATTASDRDYDIKVDLSVVDASGLTASDMTVTVNNGKPIYAAEAVELVPKTVNAVQSVSATDDYADNAKVATQAAVVVTAKVGGKTVVIPENMVTVTSGKVGDYGKLGNSGVTEKTETKTVTVVVDSTEGIQKVSADITVSNARATATEIKKSNKTTLETADNKDASALLGTIEILDQYGLSMNGSGSVIYTVTPTGAKANDLKVAKNGTQNVSITSSGTGTYTASVTYEYGGLTFTQDVTLKF